MADANLYTPYLEGKVLQSQLNREKQAQKAAELQAADEAAQRQAMMDYYQAGSAREMYGKQIQQKKMQEEQAAYFDSLKKVSDTMDVAMKLEQSSPGKGQQVFMAAYNDPVGGKLMRRFLGENPPVIQRSPEGGTALDVYNIAENMPYQTVDGKKGIMRQGKSYRMVPSKQDPTQLVGVAEIPTPGDKKGGMSPSESVAWDNSVRETITRSLGGTSMMAFDPGKSQEYDMAVKLAAQHRDKDPNTAAVMALEEARTRLGPATSEQLPESQKLKLNLPPGAVLMSPAARSAGAPPSPTKPVAQTPAQKTVVKTGIQTVGPNKGKMAIMYSDGSISYE